jgi:glycine cleavage system H protein
VKSVSDIFAPVSGEVTAVNEALEATPELINKDAYGEGWIAKIKMEEPSELDGLMTAEAYEEYIKANPH